MGRRKFTREFKVEAVRLVREQGMTIAQVGRDLDVHATLLGKWVKPYGGLWQVNSCHPTIGA